MQYPSYLKTVKSEKKRTGARRLGRLIFLAAVLLVLGGAWGVFSDITGGGNSGAVEFDIPEGASVTQISRLLKEAGLIKYPFAFRLYAAFAGKENGFQLGVHTLNHTMSYKELIEKTGQISVPLLSVTVTIPEGSELGQIADRLAKAFAEKDLPFDPDIFLKEAEEGAFDFAPLGEITRKENRLEGYLFPATYTFTEGTAERDVISAMLKKFAEVYTPAYQERAAALSMTTDQVITLASIVEREGASVSEFKTISGVFHNRLNKKMKLESCATVQFILGERKEVLSTADTRIPSPYNTYLSFGLPVGPIASPGQAAIEAALYPEETDYLYFRLTDGAHVFSKTYREHQQAVKRAGS